MTRIRRRRITDAEGQKIVALYYEGLNFAEIGRCVGRPNVTIRLYLIRIGEYEPIDTRAAQRIDGAMDWYERGYGVAAIMHHFKINEPTLYRNLHQRGIPLRSPSVSAGMKAAREVAQ